MQDVLELRRRFLGAIAEQAPQIVHDIFERNDSKAWAARWGFLSEWIIEKAERALECRTGNRDQAHTLRLRGFIFEEEELLGWRKAAEGLVSSSKPPPLEIDVFDKGKLFRDEAEPFRYLSEEELFERICSDPRIRRTIAEYHQKIFHDHPIFGRFRDLDKTRSGQEEKHMSWLIAYITGSSDPDIAAREENIEADTVRGGRRAFAKRIGLKIVDRRGRGNRT